MTSTLVRETAERQVVPHRTLVTLSRGVKLMSPSAHGKGVAAWSFQNIAALAPYLHANTVCVTCVDWPMHMLGEIDDHVAWQHDGIGMLVLHGANGITQTVNLQDDGAVVHMLTRDYVMHHSLCGKPGACTVSNAFSASLAEVAKITIPSGMSYYDFFENGQRSPEFDKIVCLKDFGHTDPSGYFSPSVIGRY